MDDGCAWFWPALQRPGRVVSSEGDTEELSAGLPFCRAGLAVPEHNRSCVQHCRNLQQSFPVTSLDPKMTGIYDDIVLWPWGKEEERWGEKA